MASLDDATAGVPVPPTDTTDAVIGGPAAGDAPATPARGRGAGRRTERAAVPDAVCAAAVDLARAAAVEEAEPGTVGEHLGAHAEGERLVTHSFVCLSRGYRGWRWAVTVARAPRSRTVTVCEVVLLPDRDAVLAPAWVPWSDRLAPGDLGVTDVLPYRADDPFLEPGYTATGDEDEDRVAIVELGLGRPRVLSPEGRAAAATRWYTGSRGPTSEEAVHAAAPCATCGFFLPLAGSLRQLFGVCANEWSPSDAMVVSLDHGCGAHSETDVEPPEPMPLPEPILDETGAEAVALPPREPRDPQPSPEPDAPQADGPEPVLPEVEMSQPVLPEVDLPEPGLSEPELEVVAVETVEPEVVAVQPEPEVVSLEPVQPEVVQLDAVEPGPVEPGPAEPDLESAGEEAALGEVLAEEEAVEAEASPEPGAAPEGGDDRAAPDEPRS